MSTFFLVKSEADIARLGSVAALKLYCVVFVWCKLTLHYGNDVEIWSDRIRGKRDTYIQNPLHG